MAEYIKRTEVMKICREYSKHCFNSNDAYGQDIADRIEDDIVALPTADVVEVVYCADCKKLFVFDNYCSYFGHKVDDNGFCSYGERRTNNDR